MSALDDLLGVHGKAGVFSRSGVGEPCARRRDGVAGDAVGKLFFHLGIRFHGRIHGTQFRVREEVVGEHTHAHAVRHHDDGHDDAQHDGDGLLGTLLFLHAAEICRHAVQSGREIGGVLPHNLGVFGVSIARPTRFSFAVGPFFPGGFGVDGQGFIGLDGREGVQHLRVCVRGRARGLRACTRALARLKDLRFRRRTGRGRCLLLRRLRNLRRLRFLRTFGVLAVFRLAAHTNESHFRLWLRCLAWELRTIVARPADILRAIGRPLQYFDNRLTVT